MKQRKPAKPRNLAAKAMHESKIFAPKTIPNKKGKGTIYKRCKQDRSDLSGPFSLAALHDHDLIPLYSHHTLVSENCLPLG